MLIILEGPDGAGKTTLAQRIGAASLLNVEIRHCGPILGTPAEEYVMPLHAYIPNTGQNIVYDRHFLGELVYGPMYRDESKIKDVDQYVIESFLNRHGALMVLVTGEESVLQSRCKARGETFIKLDDIPKLKKRYMQEFEESNITWKWLCVDDPSTEDVTNIVWLAQQIEKRVNPSALD
jgi:thymidylate kinase